MNGRAYWVVAIRDRQDEPWGVHFGSYDREDAQEERRDLAGDDSMRGNVYVFPCSDEQAAIDAAINELNGNA